LRNFKLDTTIADFCLRAKEPLAHSLRWDKEGMSNTTRIQTQNRLRISGVCMAGSIAG